MSDIVKQYKKLVLGHKFKIKELEVTLEKQTFYKEIVGEGKIKDTLRHINILKTEIQAFEKQIPKKITRDSTYSPALCPTCHTDEISKSLGDGYYQCFTDIEYCPRCGQLIVWD